MHLCTLTRLQPERIHTFYGLCFQGSDNIAISKSEFGNINRNPRKLRESFAKAAVPKPSPTSQLISHSSSPHVTSHEADYFISRRKQLHMTSKQVTSPPWNSRRLVHSKEMAWASRWSVALRAFYRQILSSSNCKDFFFKWHRPPRKLAKEVFVKFIPAKEKTRFAKEWRKVLAKDHVIRIDSHEVFNTAQVEQKTNSVATPRYIAWISDFGRLGCTIGEAYGKLGF